MILDETLQFLAARGAVTGRRLRTVHLGAYFTVVELEDGGVGACMSYYDVVSPTAAALGQNLPSLLKDDPLLLGWWMPGPNSPGMQDAAEERLVRAAVGTAVVSALSARFLGGEGDDTFAVSPRPPFDPFAQARRALVIGFGGYMRHLAQAAHIQELCICDLFYATQRQEMETVVADYERRWPGKRITLSDGSDMEQQLRQTDVVAITGSALGNGTLDALLEAARGVPRIVVQGQSAGIHPKVLFDRGVHLLATTVKPPALVQLAAADVQGRALCPLLEGGLPSIYCVPRREVPPQGNSAQRR
jgi:hypothetical protein